MVTKILFLQVLYCTAQMLYKAIVELTSLMLGWLLISMKRIHS